MLASITPLGERGRHNRWWLTTSVYELGSLAGGACIGAAAGGLGALVGALAAPSLALRLWAGAGACLVAFALDAYADGRLVHGWRRQVDRRWLDRYRGWVYGGGFGFQLGLGVVTVVNSAAVFCMLVLALLTESPAAGVVCGTVFGLARALPVLGFWRAVDFERLRQSHARLQSLGRPSRIGVMAALLAATGLLAAGALLTAGGTGRPA